MFCYTKHVQDRQQMPRKNSYPNRCNTYICLSIHTSLRIDIIDQYTHYFNWSIGRKSIIQVISLKNILSLLLFWIKFRKLCLILFFIFIFLLIGTIVLFRLTFLYASRGKQRYQDWLASQSSPILYRLVGSPLLTLVLSCSYW